MGLLSTARRLIGFGYERLEDAVRGAAGSLLLGVPAATVWAESPTLRRAFASPADLATAAFGLINNELGRLAAPGLHVGQLAGEVLASGAGPGDIAAAAARAQAFWELSKSGKLTEWLRLAPELSQRGLTPGDLGDLLIKRAWTGTLEGVPDAVAEAVERVWQHPGVAAAVKRLISSPKQAALEAGGGAAGVMVAPQAIDTVGGWLGWWGNGHTGASRPVATAVTGGTTSSATPAGTPAVGAAEAPPSPVDTASPRASADTAASPGMAGATASAGGAGSPGHVLGVPSFATVSPAPMGAWDTPPLFRSPPPPAAAAPWPGTASPPGKPDWLRQAEAQARRLLQSDMPAPSSTPAWLQSAEAQARQLLQSMP